MDTQKEHSAGQGQQMLTESPPPPARVLHLSAHASASGAGTLSPSRASEICAVSVPLSTDGQRPQGGGGAFEMLLRATQPREG